MQLWKRLGYILLLFSIIGCAGGGSSGTGTGIGPSFGRTLTLEGSIEDAATGRPVRGAELTVLETGDMATSDSAGNFTLEVMGTESDKLTLEVATKDNVSTVTIRVPSDGDFLILTIEVNPLLAEIDPKTVSMRAKIVGRCDLYFENRRIIRQANPVPPGVLCTARVVVQSNNFGLSFVPIAIQYRGCKAGSPWMTSALGATQTGINLGVGQVNFRYFNDQEHCVWRIVSPFQTEGLPMLRQEIYTETYQQLR